MEPDAEHPAKKGENNMQKYIGVKLVEAVPAIRVNGEVYERGQSLPAVKETTEEGYKVIYRDGYESWCPKAEFERANLLVDDNKHLPSGISVGQQMVDDFIAKTETITMGDRTTVVRATLRNGFEIVESSACVDPANYSEEYGAKICMEHIKNKVWMLLGFLLQTAVNGVVEKTVEERSMHSWAKKEVEIACKRENPDRKDGEFDYGCACYESALKAYKSLCEDGHSGCSIGFTKNILNRLIEGKPLTPIEDTEDAWNDITDISGTNGEKVSYQCKRASSLFKEVYADGTVKYHDVDNNFCIDINNQSGTYHSGLVQRIANEMFPITMPYYPGRAVKFYCEDFLTDEKNGDFDTVGVFYAVKPDGEKIEVNRFFAEGGRDFVEISADEYKKRKQNSIVAPSGEQVPVNGVEGETE